MLDKSKNNEKTGFTEREREDWYIRSRLAIIIVGNYRRGV